MRLAVYLVALTAFAVTMPACALTGGPLSPSERIDRTQQRLNTAPTPDARRAAAAALFAEAHLTPSAGSRFVYGTAPVVAGLVPGRRPGLRDTLVIVAAALDGPHAATLVEMARTVALEANTRGAMPERSVLVALWPSGLTAEQGIAAVRAFPLWPSDSVHLTLVLVDGLGPDTGLGTPESPVVGFQTAGLPVAMTVSDLTVTVLGAATVRLDMAR